MNNITCTNLPAPLRSCWKLYSTGIGQRGFEEHEGSSSSLVLPGRLVIWQERDVLKHFEVQLIG